MSSEQIEYLAPRALVVPPQVRQTTNRGDEPGLVQSLREVGMLQPIRARRENGQAIIVDGHRRTAAAIIAELASVPVIFESAPLGDAEIIQRQLVANCQRVDLSALEKAEALERLMVETKWSAAQAAAKLGLSAAMVTKHVALLTLPEGIRKAIVTGTIPASTAYELTQVEDADKRNELAAKLLAGKLTRDSLAAVRKADRTRNKAAQPGPAMRAVAALEAGRSVTVSSASLTLDSFIQTIEEVLAKARRERTRGVELSTFLKLLRDQSRAH